MRQATVETSDGNKWNAFRLPPYNGDQAWRRACLHAVVVDLTRHHYERCIPYKNILSGLNVDPTAPAELADLPFLPIGLFKRLELVSVAACDVSRTLTSSGTSGSVRSRVYLDRKTSKLQMLALARIVESFIGDARLPLLIVDAPCQPGDPAAYAARAIAIQGFSLFGKGRPTFALTEDMQPDLAVIAEFLISVRGKRFLVFGFTYVIWRYLFEYLGLKEIHIDLSGGILIHGGGWKRLADEKVTDQAFKTRAAEHTGMSTVHNYYGMVEQPGSIYMQCEHGFMHCSIFSEIFIRRPSDFSVADHGEIGLIQTISALPESYPGHNLLTEDLGVLHGEDDCRCGRLGKYFTIVGRPPSAEPRGCGDTYLTSR